MHSILVSFIASVTMASPNVLTVCTSGRPSELSRVLVLLRNGNRHLPHPPPTCQDRCRKVGVQSLGCCDRLVHPGEGPSACHAMGSTSGRYLWRICYLLLRHILLGGSRNVSSYLSNLISAGPSLTFLASIAACGIYYYFWINFIPKRKGYAIRQKRTVYQEDGAVTHELIRVPNAELERWDAEHDANGNKLT